LLKRRPTVELRLPDGIVPGEAFEGEVVLTADEPLELDGVDCEIQGEEQTPGLARRGTRRLAAGRGALPAPRRIPAGRTKIALRLALSPDMAPTFRGRLGHGSYTLIIHIRVPYWPDWSESFELFVAPSKAPPWVLPSTARAVATPESDLRAGAAAIRCRIDQDVVQAGQRIRTEVTVEAPSGHVHREVAVTLRSEEQSLDEGLPLDRHVDDALTAWVPLAPTPGGWQGQLDLQIPAYLQPTTRTESWRFGWTLVVGTRHPEPLRRDLVPALSIPVTVLPPSRDLSLGRVLRLADTARESKVFLRRWRHVAADLGMWPAPHGLSGRRGDIRIQMSAERREGSGRCVVAALSYPDLHLDLDGGGVDGFRRALQRDIPLGDRCWDRRHYVTGRDEQQVRPFLAMVAPLLVRHELLDLDDRHLVLQRLDPDLRLETIADLGRTAIALADALLSAKALIPPPTAMAAARPSWMRLAARLGEPLETARMAVHGRFAGTDAAVITHWSARGDPLHTAVMLRAGQPIAASSQLDLSGRHVMRGNPAELAPAARKRIEDLCQHVLAVSIGEELLCASLPAPLHDTAVVLPVLERLAAIARLLCGRGGPYRAPR
jgi:hypothetical protein